MALLERAALGQLGVETTSLVAILGAAGLAIGLALQGSLSNFAAGFLMILFRPIRVGDFIEGAGTAGVFPIVPVVTGGLPGAGMVRVSPGARSPTACELPESGTGLVSCRTQSVSVSPPGLLAR